MITKANDTVLDLSDPPRVSRVDMTDGTVTTNATSGTEIVNYQTMNTALTLAVPAGVVVPWAGTIPPPGWLLCDGQTYLQATYPNLYAVIGANFGFGGPGTFNVPDLRGRVVAAKDDMGGVPAGVVTNPAALGPNSSLSIYGFEDITLAMGEMPLHDHAVSSGIGSLSVSGTGTHTHTGSATGGSHTHGGWWGSPLSTGASGDNKNVQDRFENRSGGGHSHGIVIDPGTGGHSHSLSGSPSISESTRGSNLAHDNMQPTMFMYYIIKAI